MGRRYVETLHDMVRRNLAAGFEGRFVCFTDDSNDYAKGIEKRLLPVPCLKGWWNKLALFKPGVFDEGDRIVYFDLDTLITGRLDEIVRYVGPFAILRDFYRPDRMQSAAMAWPAGFGAHIWKTWHAAGRPDIAGGDQVWIEQQVEKADCWQDKFPGLFVSYKATSGNPPKKASIVCFHGKPRPHEVRTGWVAEVWKIGGITRAELDTICNTALAKLAANVKAASRRNLPWLDYEPEHDGHAVIVGGGPSVKNSLPEIKRRYEAGQEVWALNGSAKWLRDNWIVPDYHVVVDARPENAGFVRYGDPTTKYLIGSQCDPAVFHALLRADVTLFHSNAAGMRELLKDEQARPVHLIGGGSTVGLQAMVVAYVKGYRKIHLYGFDSSIKETAHHAYRQAANDTDLIVDVLAGDVKFRATPWMVQQAEEFCPLALELADKGCIITVAGQGLLPHLARELQLKPPVHASEIRAAEVLKRLNGSDRLTGAEIGVFTGDMSAALLRDERLTLYMIDSWEGGGAAYASDTDDFHAGLAQEQQDGCFNLTVEQTAFADSRRTILRGRSVEMAKAVPDGALDFVFIDADHSYEGCKADIQAWLPKVKSGGLLAGHDYENDGFPKFGVKRAVDEFVAASGLGLDLGENYTWFIRKEAADV